MRHTPMERFGWEQLVRRAELPSTTKLVALMLATFANPGGGRVRPGESLLADCCGLRERAVREHLAALRLLGLLEVVIEGRRGRASVYQLTIPGPAALPIPMRLDPDGDRLAERGRGKGGGKREKTGTTVPAIDDLTGTGVPVNNPMTGTQVPVDTSVDRHAGAGGGIDDRHPDAELPAPPRTMTGTPTSIDRHPGASHHTDQPNQPRPTGVTLAGYVTYAADNTTNTPRDHAVPDNDPGLTVARPVFDSIPDEDTAAPNPSAHPQPAEGTDWRPRDIAFAEARRTLDHSRHRDVALTQARMELAALGHHQPQFRDLVVAAALIADALASQDSAPHPDVRTQT